MASIIVKLPTPPLMASNERPPTSWGLHRVSIPASRDRVGVITKASGGSSESSIVKSVQSIWNTSEDRVAVIGFGFTAVVAFWASINLLTAVDKTPLLPGVFELIGILFSAWFTYRYLLYKPDREELYRTIKKTVADILGR